MPLGEELLQMPAEDFQRVQRDSGLHDERIASESVSYGQDVRRRFLLQKRNVVCLLILFLLAAMSIVGPSLSPYGYQDQNLAFRNLPPRIPFLEKLGICDGTRVVNVREEDVEDYAFCLVENLGPTTTAFSAEPMIRLRIHAYRYQGVEEMYFWFGTDSLGRDLFARLWQGARTSLVLALAVVAINLTLGLAMGAVCGYYGGWVDMLLQRMMDVIQNIPTLLLTVVLVLLFGSDLLSLVLIFGLTGWMGTANGVRMQFYRYKNREYVLAARTMGRKDLGIMFRHILPNAVGTVITQNALAVPSIVFQEAMLAYLGLGLTSPGLSIGTLLAAGQQELIHSPYLLVPPSLFIVALMLAFNMVGNGLRDAFNPAAFQGD